MYVGADYYPEHWPRERWDEDIRLMKEAGFNVVRLAEFDWANLEPEEGRYEFGMWDDVLGRLNDAGIKALMCTPTASMPAWMARRYPECREMLSIGRRKTWGSRRDNCFSSEEFLSFARGITQAMADHFRGHPAVIGWQPDNELGHPLCYCDGCRKSFQDWLRRRYGTLDGLNAAWGTHFWGHQIQAWEEIVIPDNFNRHNPGALLDKQRHFSWQVERFLNEQVRILRAASKDWFVTHNFMMFGWQEVDYFDLARELDFVSWDNYPDSAPSETRYGAAMGADQMRGFKGRNFWITEQTAGTTGASRMGRNLRPGELRSIAYQQLARGCDGQIWFRWRTCTVGREQYWHGLLGHDGRPQRRYREAARTAGEYHRLWESLEGTTVQADVAFVYDFDSDFASRIQPTFETNHHIASLRRYYDAFLRAGINVDFVAKTQNLQQYKIVAAPNLHVLPDPVAEALVAYVEQGGVLLTDCRTAVKDESNRCHPRTLPGLLTPALGIEIEEYEALPSMEYGVHYADAPDSRFTAAYYLDWVIPRQAECLAEYDEAYLKGFAAVTRNTFGRGAGYYVGCVVRESAFYDRIVQRLLDEAGLEPVVRPPEGVEVSIRAKEGLRVLFVMNHTDQQRIVPVPPGTQRLLGTGATDGTLLLEPYGVEVLRL